MPRGEPTVVIQVRVTPTQKAALEQHAKGIGEKLSTRMRDLILEDAGIEGARKRSKRHAPAPPTAPPRASADSGKSAPSFGRGQVSRSADVVRKPAFGVKKAAPK